MPLSLIHIEMCIRDSCYTVEDARLGATQTLTEVAEALVSNVDAPLRAYAATIPVNQR